MPNAENERELIKAPKQARTRQSLSPVRSSLKAQGVAKKVKNIKVELDVLLTETVTVE